MIEVTDSSRHTHMSRKRRQPSSSRVQNSGRDRIKQMVIAESLFRQAADQKALEESTQAPAALLWREHVVQWFYDVVDHMELSREIVFLAMNMLDRCIAIEGTEDINKVQYELMSTTCLFLAIRTSGRRLKISRLLQMCQSSVQVKDIQAFGRRVLQTLSLKQRIISPSSFTSSFLQLLQSHVSSDAMCPLLETTSYLVEIAICDPFFMKVPPSHLALAAVLQCLTSKHHKDLLPEKTKNDFLKALEEDLGLCCTSSQIQRLVERLASIYQQSLDGAEHNSPHFISDEDENDQVEKLGSSTESLPSLMPCRPILSDISSESNKRARLI